MTEANLIRRNSLFSLLTMSSRLIGNIIVFWLIARIYGPDTFGNFSFTHTVSTLLVLFADFGFDLLLTTEISKARNNSIKIFQNIFSYKIIFSLVAFVSMWLFSYLGNHNYETQASLWIFSFFILFTTLTNFSLALIKGFEKYSYESVVVLTSNITLIFSVLALSIFYANILIIALVFVASRLIGLIISLYYSKKVLPNISFKIRFSEEKDLHKKVLTFGFHLLFANLFFQIDTILLSLWKGNLYVGLYQAVFKLIILPLMIPDILNLALLPVLSRLFVSEKQKALKVLYLMNKLLFITSLPITIILYVYSEDIINLIYGYNQYAASVPVLRIFALNIFFRFSFEAFALILTTTNKQTIRMYTVIVATAVNFTLNYFLIPKFGLIGAATVSLISIVIVYGAYSFYSRVLIVKWYFNASTFILVLLAILFGYILSSVVLIDFYIGVPTILIFFSLVGFYFYFNQEERKTMFYFNFFSNIKKT